MALPSIGAHCSVASCNLNDFLPIRCRCDQLFCKDHISPELHACPIDLAACKPAHPSAKLERCALRGCTKPSLEVFVSDRSDSPRRSSAVCPGCRLSFCALYDPSSHSNTLVLTLPSVIETPHRIYAQLQHLHPCQEPEMMSLVAF